MNNARKKPVARPNSYVAAVRRQEKDERVLMIGLAALGIIAALSWLAEHLMTLS